MAEPDAIDRRIAAALLDIEAVLLSPHDPFTWASGLRAPIYCDNRLTVSYPSIRRMIASGFAAYIRERELVPDVIVGTATAGIPHAAWLADRLDLPMAYVRSKPKAHGRGSQIEGRIEEGQRAVVVEDLISTGRSSMTVVEAVRDAGVDVSTLLAIFSYGLQESGRRFEQANVCVHTLTSFDTLLRVAMEEERLNPEALETLQDWQRDPAAWSEAFTG